MRRILGTVLLALTVGVMLTAGPCLDCVAKVKDAPHSCCGKSKPEPAHKCAAEAKTTAAEAKVITAEPLTPALAEVTIVILPDESVTEIEAIPEHAEGPPVFLSLESFRC